MENWIIVKESETGYGTKRVVLEKLFSFAVKILKFSKDLKSLGNVEVASQLLRSGTSIGANIEEAQGGFSKNDFRFKMSLALKEARETDYWIRLIKASEIVSVPEDIQNEIKEILKILTAIVKTLNSK
ncbi:MAG: four helix bundle protein [Bacteroidota bacterium]|nr:four helix bundle protein [Bacteroidota bacterium]MDX5405196.1 four helix bundle protein [Bacteroidota bacterium]MDX5428575.1 four helix bundle protein [Bacteroidota bacterium]MDX5506329.1 four helix bundle protein [Bacteroidota bacterium]